MWFDVDMTGGATVKSTTAVGGVISLAACTIFRLWISAALRKTQASQNVGNMLHTCTNNSYQNSSEYLLLFCVQSILSCWSQVAVECV